ncbi:MAG: hypothetical protein ACJ77B_02410 [Chloroflexota bacterium]
MTDSRRSPEPTTRPRPFPAIAKLGVGTLVFGLLFDVVEHTLVFRTPEPTIAGFPVAEHAAHAIVLVGMILVLAGIVADGVRLSRRPGGGQRSNFSALR